jgi:LuxR family maltose regulon positive regulatory protein
MVARVHLALGRFSQALEVLSPLLLTAKLGKRLWNQLRVLALQVVALWQSGETELAREVAADLLAMSEAEGYIRVYLDAGPMMKDVLVMLREARFLSASFQSFLSRLLTAFQQEEEQRAGRVEVFLAHQLSPFLLKNCASCLCWWPGRPTRKWHRLLSFLPIRLRPRLAVFIANSV